MRPTTALPARSGVRHASARTSAAPQLDAHPGATRRCRRARGAGRCCAYLVEEIDRGPRRPAEGLHRRDRRSSAAARTFDAQSDPVVRLEARRLRRDLDSYYAGRGPSKTRSASAIPKGGYAPHVRLAGPTPRAPRTRHDPGARRAAATRHRWPGQALGRRPLARAGRRGRSSLALQSGRLALARAAPAPRRRTRGAGGHRAAFRGAERRRGRTGFSPQASPRS